MPVKYTCEICGLKTCRLGEVKITFLAKFPLDVERQLSRKEPSFTRTKVIPPDADELCNLSSLEEKDLGIGRQIWSNPYTSLVKQGREDTPDSPNLRFERQELFKHNALRSCLKKLALTVKITSPDPSDAENTDANSKKASDDEYIPIDHVLEGPDKKRVRLLNPYILRLRRQSPKQAYKLHRIDTVSGVLTKKNLMEDAGNETSRRQVINRERRELDPSEQPEENGLLLGSAASVFSLDHDDPSRHSYSVRIGRLQELIQAASATPPGDEPETTLDCGLRLFNTNPQSTKPSPLNYKRNSDELYENNITKDKRGVCPETNSSSLGREKRQKQMSMTVLDEAGVLVTPKYFQGKFHQQVLNDEDQQKKESYEKVNPTDIEDSRVYDARKIDLPRHSKSKQKERRRPIEVRKLSKHRENVRRTENLNEKNIYPPKGEFALYEIGDPNLWYDIKVHLFEKLSTLEGKTVWNDLTQGKDASVSSANPEWRGQDVNVRYTPAEWVPRDEFTLPVTRLCLLEPLRDNTSLFEDEMPQPNSAYQNYIVVPIEDVVYMSNNKMNMKKRDGNISSTPANDTSDPNDDQDSSPRRVEVRVSRAIVGSRAEQFDIARLGAEQFLTLPHRRPHHSQIDVEVKADDNVLVRVGSSGRLATVVTDNSRKKRTTVYFQATNTGLASARFKAVIRECGPELSTQMKEQGIEEITSEPIVLSPHHTRRMKLEVTAEIPTDVTHCNVALLNEEGESVAMREFSIKKGDRCFCVWHCDCVCLGDDPKLVCRDMSQPQQVAAGLAPATRPRQARSLCYQDIPALDFLSVMLSVLVFLLLLGLIKAFAGIVSVRAGQLGWERVLATPHELARYHEPCLRHRTVVYEDGWPVHPDTKQRSVRILSCPGSFLMNLIFFIIVPCLAIYNMTREFINISCRCLRSAKCKIQTMDKPSVFSAHDLQSESLELVVRKKHRRRRLTKWMTPLAEQLTGDVIRTSMEPALAECTNDEMQPLLHETKQCSKSEARMSGAADSEQEDTDYVLMQMQKSRESLAVKQSHEKKAKRNESSQRNQFG